MSRETEFLTRHKDDLKRGAELCRLLQKNAIEPAPRERHYLELRLICRRLEGTSRQMAHERGDDFRWLSLGNHYVEVGKMILRLRRTGKWMAFADLAKVFEVGLRRIDMLATQATGLTSISGTQPFLVLPPHLRKEAANSNSSLILPP